MSWWFAWFEIYSYIPAHTFCYFFSENVIRFSIPFNNLVVWLQKHFPLFAFDYITSGDNKVWLHPDVITGELYMQTGFCLADPRVEQNCFIAAVSAATDWWWHFRNELNIQFQNMAQNPSHMYVIYTSTTRNLKWTCHHILMDTTWNIT